MSGETEKPTGIVEKLVETPEIPPPPPPPAPALIRRGRGKFECRLRMDGRSEGIQPAGPAADVSSGATTAAREGKVLPGDTLNADEDLRRTHRDPENANLRSEFGASRHPAESLQWLLYSGEKKQRYCVLVGDLVRLQPLVSLRLEGRHGKKPVRLRKKDLKLISFAVSNPQLLELNSNAARESGEGEALLPADNETATTREPQACRDEVRADEPGTKDRVSFLRVDEEDEEWIFDELSSCSSAVLTTKRIESLSEFFSKELEMLLLLDDVRLRKVSVRLHFGASYGCNRTYADVLSQSLSVSQFVRQINENLLEMYFLRESPGTISRALKQCCNDAYQQHISVARITIRGEDGQRTTARAYWSNDISRFVVMDMETYGESMSWTVFFLDYYGQCDIAGKNAEAVSALNRKKNGYPFEVELRAFRRWKTPEEDAVKRFLQPILDKLSLAERGYVTSGRLKSFDELNLSFFCHVDDNSDDVHLESIVVEHVDRLRLPNSLLMVDTAATLFFENFEEARRISRRPLAVQKIVRRFTTTSYVHWKIQSGVSAAKNAVPIKEAIDFALSVLSKANDPSNIIRKVKPPRRPSGTPQQSRAEETEE